MKNHNPAVEAKSATNHDDLAGKAAPGPVEDPSIAELTAELGAISERLGELEAKSTADPAAPQAAESTALAERIAELEQTITELKAAPGPAHPAAEPTLEAALITELKTTIERLGRRVDGFEAKGQAPADPGAGHPVSYAQAVFNAAEKNGLAEQWKSGQMGHMPSSSHGGIEVPSMFAPANDGAKAATPIGLTQVGDLAPTYRDTDLVSKRAAPACMLDVIPYLGVDGATSYEYYVETGASQYGYVHTTCTTLVDGDPTPKNTMIVDDVSGFVVGQDIRIHLAASTEIETIVSLTPATNTITVGTDEFDYDVPIGTSVTSTVYGATAESGTKPAGLVAYSKLNPSLKTIAITAPITMQALNSVAGLQSFIAEELQYRQKLVLDWHVLYGDITVIDQLDGFLTNTSAQTYLWSSGEVGDTRADAVMRARTQIRPKGPLTVTMNEADWLTILLAKASSDGHYINTVFGPVQIVNTPERRAIGDITVNLCEAMQQGDFLLANHARASKFVDQQRSSFATGYVNTQFIQNEITARHEDTVYHAIRNFQSYVYGSWNSAPT